MKNITESKLIIIVAVFLVAFGNVTFFEHVLDVYPLNLENGLFLSSLVILYICVNIILLSLVCNKYTIKPILITILLISSLSAYFMDAYNVIIDYVMMDNVVKTDLHETLDLISVKQFLYLLFMGILPSLLIYKTNIAYSSLKKSILSRIKLGLLCFVVLISVILIFSNFYASFFREHKPLRYYSNPSYYLYSTGKYLGSFFKTKSIPLKAIGLDAKIPSSDEHRELIVFVVGETARADHLSLNGYGKKTNPYLEKERVISFKNVWSCGTSTAVSVPCLFSIYNRSSYSQSKAKTTENVLDILQRVGVNVIWLDNNSDSKGVADRVPYESYKTSDKNTVCDIECRDEGMLANLQAYIDSHPRGDIFIILHQMGNHGPAYYKRYPLQFEKFIPTCKTNQLEQCSTEEISNSYDNALLYTDYFLSQTIALLKKNDDEFEAALLYVSDHGESLGEHKLYLHGFPYMIAPSSQRHIPLVMWFSESFDEDEINLESLASKVNNKFSHDNIFHTILGLLEVETDVYNKDMDIVRDK